MGAQTFGLLITFCTTASSNRGAETASGQDNGRLPKMVLKRFQTVSATSTVRRDDGQRQHTAAQRRCVRSGQHRRSQHRPDTSRQGNGRRDDGQHLHDAARHRHRHDGASHARQAAQHDAARHGRRYHAAAACAPGCNTYGVALIATLTITQAAHRRGPRRSAQRGARNNA